MLKKQPKPKICTCCGVEFIPQRIGQTECSYTCYNKIHKEPFKASVPKGTYKAKKRISPFSQKKLDDLAIYRPIRDKYLDEHRWCEVDGCGKPSTNLHHKATRTGYADDWARENEIKLLWDVRYFMACCGVCHPFKIHQEANDGWARKHGYLITL